MNTTMHNRLTLRNAFLALLLLFSSWKAMAQPDGPDGPQDEKRKERIERLKRAYISEKLDLTVEEAEKFWPIYNDFNGKRESIRKAIRQAHKSMDAATTDKQVSDLLDQIATNRKEEVEAEIKFGKDALPVLGPEKTKRLMGLEQEFKKEMMQRLKERRDNGQGAGGGQRGPRQGR